MQKLIFLGSGPYHYALYDCAGARDGQRYELAGFCQNLDPARRGETFEGRPVHWVEDLPALAATHEFICPLADPAAKRRFVTQVEPYGLRYANLVGELTHISPHAKIGEGLCLCRLSTICSHTTIGRHCTIMISVVIGDDVTIGDHVFIGAGTKFGGGIRVGHGVFIGLNSSIRDRVSIGDGATIGTGSVVVKDVPAGATVVGNPARVVERSGGLFRKRA